MASVGAQLLRVVLLALVAALACGCAPADEHVVELRAWTLVAPGRPPRPLLLPARVNGDLPHHDTEYVLRTTFDPPADLRGRPLTLAFSFLHAKAHLFADGEAMTPLDPAMLDGFRGVDQPRWRIPARLTRAGPIELELRVEYHHVMNAWLDVAPRLSDTAEGDARFRAIAWVNRAQAVACLLTVAIMSLLYGIVFLRDRRRKENGWLALQAAFGGAGYALAYADGLSQRLFGVYENSFVPVFLCVGVVASVEFTHAQFALPRPSRAWWWALAGCVLVAVAVPSPFVGPRIVPAYAGVMTVACVAYQVPVAWRLGRTRKSLGAFVIFLSWLALGVLGLPDLLAWSGLGEIAWGLRGACLGLGLIGFMQAIVLSVAHQRALSDADRLNVELSTQLDAVRTKNREVELLNEELRRQIAARADALAAALARASAAADGAAADLGEDRAPSRQQTLAPGDVVAGRYRVVRSVGAGATGAVYEVTRIADDKRLALKLLSSAAGATEMARFAREAQIIAQLDHPNVVRIADIDASAAGYFFLVTEFVEGLSVRHHHMRYRDVPWALAVLAQVAEGLSAIHARGIVHRDLKPANVLVETMHATSRPRVKIADFGISSVQPLASARMRAAPPLPHVPVQPGRADAERADSEPPTVGDTVRAPESPPDKATLPDASSRSSSSTGDTALTHTGALMGTPRYMAPELAQGAKNARPATDVFAFGVMAYEMLAGAAPFADSPAMMRLRGEPLVAPSFARACPSLGARVAALLRACLAEDPEARPGARDLAAALHAETSRSAPSDETWSA